MSDFVVLLLPEYRYLQLVQRIGPFEAPRGGPDRVSAEYLVERGLLEFLDGQVVVTLLGAVAAAAEIRQIDDTAVAIDRAIFDECHDLSRSGDPSTTLRHRDGDE